MRDGRFENENIVVTIKVSQTVHGFRRGLQELDEEPVERYHQAEGRRERHISYVMERVAMLWPEEQISQAAQFYNQDIKKIEEQIAQSRKKKKG